MLKSSFSTAIRRARRQIWRVTAAVLLAALTAASLGIAVPKIVQRVSDELYPCMSCACSCASAEACWRNCCCFTQTEKLAWAAANGVTPPAFVVTAARAEAELPPCCRKRVASCCKKKSSCCQKPSEEREVARQMSATGNRSSKTVLLIDELRCQGVGVHWTMLPPCVVPPLVSADETPPCQPELLAFSDCLYSSQAVPPELPPPERDV